MILGERPAGAWRCLISWACALAPWTRLASSRASSWRATYRAQVDKHTRSAADPHHPPRPQWDYEYDRCDGELNQTLLEEQFEWRPPGEDSNGLFFNKPWRYHSMQDPYQAHHQDLLSLDESSTLPHPSLQVGGISLPLLRSGRWQAQTWPDATDPAVEDQDTRLFRRRWRLQHLKRAARQTVKERSGNRTRRWLPRRTEDKRQQGPAEHMRGLAAFFERVANAPKRPSRTRSSYQQLDV